MNGRVVADRGSEADMGNVVGMVWSGMEWCGTVRGDNSYSYKPPP